MSIVWEQRFAHRVQRMKSSAIRELLKVTEQPEVISFAGGLPAAELFPVERVKAATCKVLEERGAQALQYGATEGYRPLREWIARRMSRGALRLDVENVLVTSGSQQALDLLGKIMIDPGDRIVVEAPTYMGALNAWNPYETAYVTVSMDEYGLRTDELDEAFQQGPKYIYVLPNFQNPTGVTLTAERRQALLGKARQYGVPVIEDDPYGELRFEGEELPSLLSLEGEQQAGAYQGNVIYLGTFSKTLAPGMRLGWVIAPTKVISKLVLAKQGADLHTASFSQVVAYELAKDGFLDEHVPEIRRVYRERRDAMLAAMEEHFPAGVDWTHPRGGLFLWVTLPEGINATELLRAAVERQVVFVPGEAFYSGNGMHNTLRLNYSHDKPERIYEGIKRLGSVMQRFVRSDEMLSHS
jgi:2-aminoadipate transaminase